MIVSPTSFLSPSLQLLRLPEKLQFLWHIVWHPDERRTLFPDAHCAEWGAAGLHDVLGRSDRDARLSRTNPAAAAAQWTQGPQRRASDGQEPLKSHISTAAALPCPHPLTPSRRRPSRRRAAGTPRPSCFSPPLSPGGTPPPRGTRFRKTRLEAAVAAACGGMRRHAAACSGMQRHAAAAAAACGGAARARHASGSGATCESCKTTCAPGEPRTCIHTSAGLA